MKKSLKDIIVNDLHNVVKIDDYAMGYNQFLEFIVYNNLGFSFQEVSDSYQFLFFPARTNQYWM